MKFLPCGTHADGIWHWVEHAQTSCPGVVVVVVMVVVVIVIVIVVVCLFVCLFLWRQTVTGDPNQRPLKRTAPSLPDPLT
jgi:uncharacterized membrane protein